MSTPSSDLTVTHLSDALAGRRIDVVVSGSIAAVEAVRFIRALRRLGAEVIPRLSQGGAQFITPMALEWAANHTCTTGFSGTATHICTSDAIVIAPASSSFIGRVASGITDTPTSALVASGLGQNKPIFFLPAMHDSLAHAPSYRTHMDTIAKWDGVKILTPRMEEGKRKFPEPATLADQIAHELNRPSKDPAKVLVTMGTTRGYVDDVRYFSNYSSGKLGSTIAEELYRHGYQTVVVSGPAEFKPKVAGEIVDIRTTSEMLAACQKESMDSFAAIFCASVLDYEPSQTSAGKIRSGSVDLTVKLKPTPKIIEQIRKPGLVKIGFKLEMNLDENHAKVIADDYCKKYHLTALIANNLSAVNATSHKAWAITSNLNATQLNSKQEIAQYIVRLFSEAPIAK